MSNNNENNRVDGEYRRPLLNLDDTTSIDWDRLFERKQVFSTMVMNGIDVDLSSSSSKQSSVIVNHVIVLVHGWLGNSLEMDSLKESLQSVIIEEQNKQQQRQTSSSSNPTIERHRFVVHSALCNEGKTTDGIDAGGRRLAQEINSLLQYVVRNNNSNDDEDDENNNAENRQHHQKQQFTLTICGNSLGGLYARRALADIEWTVKTDQESSSSIQSQTATTTTTNTITPMLFVTTATPHLGVSQHTFIKLPRAVEYPIAQVLEQTGRDLFRFSNILQDLTFDPKYIRPLLQFQQRIAYANMYSTDFQVPTPTAAFWAVNSDSPHHVVDMIIQPSSEEESDNNDNKQLSDSVHKSALRRNPPSTIVMTVSTPPQHDLLLYSNEGSTSASTNKNDNDSSNDGDYYSSMYREWSKQLDRLGWTKVLVDVREHVPTVHFWSTKDSSSSSSSEDDGSSSIADESNNKNDGKESYVTTKKTWTADELLQKFGTGLLESTATMRKGLFFIRPPPPIRLPMGHTVMVANAKDEFNKWVNSGGKPVMDWLSQSIVEALQASSSTSVLEE